MPLHEQPKQAVSSVHQTQVVFYPLLFLTFVLWMLYRAIFQFPVWFDEIIGKALFFGLPVWLYITIAGSQKILETMSLRKLQTGILLGLAVGGIFGFATSLLSIVTHNAEVQAVSLFTAPQFWGEFLLALFTAFWETLLFFTFALGVIQEKYSNWSETSQALFAALIFLAFHIPNIFIRFSGAATYTQIALLFLFGLGQAFLFIGRRNTYALILSHAIWGMVLLVHTW